MHPAQIVYAIDPIKIPTGMSVIASHHLHAAVLALWASITLLYEARFNPTKPVWENHLHLGGCW